MWSRSLWRCRQPDPQPQAWEAAVRPSALPPPSAAFAAEIVTALAAALVARSSVQRTPGYTWPIGNIASCSCSPPRSVSIATSAEAVNGTLSNHAPSTQIEEILGCLGADREHPGVEHLFGGPSGRRAKHDLSQSAP